MYREIREFGGAFHSTQIPVISVGTSNGTDNFGLVRPEYSGPAFKVVLFDRSGHFGRLDRNVPFHLTKLLFPVPLFCILLARTITKHAGGLGRVCGTGMYRSIEHGKFPEFQTGIFVEWKAPWVYWNKVSFSMKLINWL